MSDMQRQLATICEQNQERDASLKNLEKDMTELKEASKRTLTPDNDEMPKGKRSRKTPCGLSVSC